MPGQPLTYDGVNISIKYKIDQDWQQYKISTIARFLQHVIQHHKLSILDYLQDMGHDPFFLVAATGLGKTVAVPPHIFLRMCEKFYRGAKVGTVNVQMPRVYVVEPRIPIAVEEMEHMNHLFAEYIRSSGMADVPSNPVLFGSVTSATGQIHPQAPIKFVTTGILGLLAENGDLEAGRDRVIIDEAHVTVEQNGDVELAIAICRDRGVVVDYMSATVDTRNIRQVLGVQNVIVADKQRFPIWLHNLKVPLEECVVELVEQTLVNPRPDSQYFPTDAYPHKGEVLQGVLESTDRASGMLIVVNSFQSETSDINRFAKMIEAAHYNHPTQQVVVLKLASAIIRDSAKRAAFEQQMATIQRRRQRYVIIATSVVEMGITYPTLDFVVTMDSGFQNETIEDVTLPRLVPLGPNALKQRVGRVGRKRAGIGYITREVGADYTELDDDKLNGNGLRYEAIKLPLATAPLTKLALYSFVQGWTDPVQGLAQLNLPSRIHEDASRVESFLKERQRLIDLYIAQADGLTPLGQYCKQWVGMAELTYAVSLQRGLERKWPVSAMYLYLVAVALSQTSLSDLLPVYGRFLNHHPDEDKQQSVLVSERSFMRVEGRSGIMGMFRASQEETLRQTLQAQGYQVFEEPFDGNQVLIRAVRPAMAVSAESEILTLYRIVRHFSNAYSPGLYGQISELEYAAQMKVLFEEAESMGLDGFRVRNALNSLNSTLRYFQRINKDRPELAALLGTTHRLILSQVQLPEVPVNIAAQFIAHINRMPERERITLSPDKFDGMWKWQNEAGTKQGTLEQFKTTVQLSDQGVLTAKILPEMAHEEWENKNAWKPIHMQVGQ